MDVFERITVDVPTHAAEAMRRSIRSGEYSTESELLNDLLREWTKEQSSSEQGLEKLRQLIAEGDDSGPTIPAGQVFAELRERLTRRLQEK